MLAVKKHNIVCKNPLATGTKRGIAVKSDVDVGWERSEPIKLVYNNYLLPVLGHATRMKLGKVEPLTRFRLTNLSV
jgi:hypothetical protein